MEVPCHLHLSYKIMETSITNQSGGIAAETPNVNSNQQPDPHVDMIPTNEESIMLKAAAVKFDCAVCSLKNNIKSSKLAATKADIKAPYMVRPSLVERFLRDTPGIKSKFHPKSPGISTMAAATEPVPTAPNGQPPTLKPPALSEVTPNPSDPVIVTTKSQPVESNRVNSFKTPLPIVTADSEQESSGPKRRRRRRGKGGGGNPPVATSLQPVALNALAGMTLQERLRITACLTELIGLVASA